MTRTHKVVHSILGWAMILALVAAIGILKGEKQQAAAQTNRVQWEYKIVFYGIGRDPSEEEFNRYGADGWELVTHYGSRYVFKRPK